MRLFFFFCLLAPAFVKAEYTATPFLNTPDSVGVIRYNGKTFILHKIDKGQTMYSLTRRYGTTIAAIKDANPGLAEQISENETIRIPYSGKPAVTEAPAVSKTPETKPVVKPEDNRPASGVIHKVEVGQTLYSIAGRYGVSMDDIRKWNNMSNNNVILGQELIVSERGAQPKKPEKITQVNTDTTKVKPVAEKIVKPIAEEEVAKAVETRSVRESGLAEKIDAGVGGTKYLALHRTAAIGSLVEVTNEVNQEKLFVKIVGRIPDTVQNQEVIIKLSNKAFEKLSPNSRRFRAEITFQVAK